LSIKPIKPKNISNEVMEQIKAHIISGEWSPGSKIPGEIELTKLFGVSRVSVRNAIQQLVGMGVLCIRRGDGTYVTEMLPQQYFNSLLPMLMIESPELSELLEFRAIIEIESARLAASRADEQDITRMQEILKKMQEKSGDYKEFSQEDLNFHTAIALATHNRVLVKVNAVLHDMLQSAMDEVINIMGFQGGLHYHDQLLNTIKNRDEAASMKVMREHIDRTIKLISDYYNTQVR